MARDVQQSLLFAGDLARELIRNGAEMYRVEDTARRVLRAFGFSDPEVFAVPGFVLITVQEGEHSHTRSVRIHSTSSNLDKLEKLNALSRKVCVQELSAEQAISALQEIKQAPSYSIWIGFLSHGGIAFFFTLLFGGSLVDALASTVLGCGIRCLTWILGKRHVGVFFTNLCGSMLLALAPIARHYLGIPIEPSYVVIGAIMLLVPGVAITNVMRDVIVGDFMTAVSRLTEVLLVAVALAVGYALPVALLGLGGM